jgi:hypothetical protein
MQVRALTHAIDLSPENRKVGGSTPPLPTAFEILGQKDLRQLPTPTLRVRKGSLLVQGCRNDRRGRQARRPGNAGP